MDTRPVFRRHGQHQVNVQFLDALYGGGRLTPEQRNAILCGANPTGFGLSDYDLYWLTRGRLGSDASAQSSGDLEYICSAAVRVGDPVGITGDDFVEPADASIPLLAVGFCVSRSDAGLCVVRKAGLVQRLGVLAGRIYYLGAGPGVLAWENPGTDSQAKVLQSLAVGKNGKTLAANVTLNFITLGAS